MLGTGLATLRQHHNFILYRTEREPISGKLNKVPTVSVTDPSKWLSYDGAVAKAAALGDSYGVGFVLTPEARIAVVDLDNCRDASTSRLTLEANDVISMLPGAYLEVSISGTGLHIWFSYSGEMPPHACTATVNGIKRELYHRDRFFALGKPYEAEGFINGNVAMNLGVMLPYVIATYFPPPAVKVGGDGEWTSGPCAEWSGPEEDSELIRRATRTTSAAAAFGNKARFVDLWEANAAVLGTAYPDTVRSYDASRADSALAQHLAFWTGRDCERIERLMTQSALVRDKWERGDYLMRTILRAVAMQEEVLQDKPPSPLPAASGITLTPVERTLANVGTQDAVALIFTGRMAGKLIYDRTRNAWMQYDGTRWKLDRLGVAHNLIRDIARELNYEGKAAMASASFCDGVDKHLQSTPEFARTSDQFDCDNYLLNTPAGTLNLRTGMMRPHGADDMLTLCTSAAPVAGDGAAFQKFMAEITANDWNLIQFHQVSLGACLSGAVEGHWMLFWTGGGRNGKNTLGDLVQHVMGDYARKIPASTLMSKGFDGHPTDIANLQGLRLATSSEINDGDHWNEALINEVTGDAKLSARFMRGDFFEFKRTHKHLIYGNYKPQLRSVSDGIRSRIKIVPFNVSFKGRENADLPKLLENEIGHVLLWLIEGHRQWLEAGKKLPKCPAVEAESDQYFENQATPQLWLAERVERVESDDRPSQHLPKVSELYRDYKQWKEARGERAVSQSRWMEAMRGLESVRTKLGTHYRGVRLLPLPNGDYPFTGVPYPPVSIVQ